MWILGLSVLFYETSQINYKLIFRFETNNLPHSRYILQRASFFSLLYLALFILFVASLADLIPTNFIYFGEVFWLIIILHVFIPLPILNYKQRLYFVKLMLNVVLSPCVPMSFLIIWVSEQLVSFVQPFGDLFYTICNFTTRDGSNCRALTPNFISAYVITMFTLRIFQNLKFWHQVSIPNKKHDFWAPQFMGFVRATFGLNTAIAALVPRL